MARSLAETLDPQEALERALAAIGEGLGWRLGAAWEPPPDGRTCSSAWRRGARPAWTTPSSWPSRATSGSRPARAFPGGCGRQARRRGSPTSRTTRTSRARRPRVAPACTPPSASRSGARAACWAWSSSTPARRASWTPSCSRRWPRWATRSARPWSGAGTPSTCAPRAARHEAMLEAALDAVITHRRDGPRARVQPRRRADLRLPGAEAVGREMAELIVPPELRERHRARLRAVPGDREPAVLDRRLELTGMRADGSSSRWS